MKKHPVSTVYLDQQIARPSGILALVSAWDAAPLALPCMFFDEMTLYFTYALGGAAGAFDFKVEVSAESTGAIWHQLGLYAPGVLAAGADTQSREQREFLTYTATAAGAELFVYGSIELASTVERVRITARESGNAGAPGTLQIKARFS